MVDCRYGVLGQGYRAGSRCVELALLQYLVLTASYVRIETTSSVIAHKRSVQPSLIIISGSNRPTNWKALIAKKAIPAHQIPSSQYPTSPAIVLTPRMASVSYTPYHMFGSALSLAAAWRSVATSVPKSQPAMMNESANKAFRYCRLLISACWFSKV